MIGELPKGTPNNLVPYLTQVAHGKRKELTIFGDDYDTPDGTGVRDFIHVVDLAEAHIAALDYLQKQPPPFYDVFNVGTGQGTSVKELIETFEKINGVKVPYKTDRVAQVISPPAGLILLKLTDLLAGAPKKPFLPLSKMPGAGRKI